MESLFETVHDGIEPLEYATVLIITFIMGFVGFPEGIGAGVVLSCVFFVFMYSRSSAIRETFTGKDVSSTISRPFRHQLFLDKVGTQTRILKLQGFMFFGTANQCTFSFNNSGRTHKRHDIPIRAHPFHHPRFRVDNWNRILCTGNIQTSETHFEEE